MKYFIYITHILLMALFVWKGNVITGIALVSFAVPAMFLLTTKVLNKQIEKIDKEIEQLNVKIAQLEVSINSTKERVNKYISQRNPGVLP
jgi:outer membrane murein-binding lipoprotein Lpp